MQPEPFRQEHVFPNFRYRQRFPSLSRGKVPGLGRFCYQTLDGIQPYKGGWGHRLWQLHQLDIVDKHRLVLSIATVPVGRSMMPSERAAFDERQTFIGPHGSLLPGDDVRGSALIPPRSRCRQAINSGRFPATEEYEKVGFAFDIAIDEIRHRNRDAHISCSCAPLPVKSWGSSNVSAQASDRIIFAVECHPIRHPSPLHFVLDWFSFYGEVSSRYRNAKRSFSCLRVASKSWRSGIENFNPR